MDNADKLARATGLSRQSIMEIAEGVKVNSARLNACAAHRFEPIQPAAPLRTRYRCAACQGEIDSHAHHWYSRGLAHGAIAP